MSRKTAKEKLNAPKPLPKIKVAPDVWGGGQILSSHPCDVDKAMKRVPIGSVINTSDPRK